LRSRDQIMDIVCMALAGRAAEEVFFGQVTTGASDDLRRVTQLVYSMIKDYGMHDSVGQLAYPSQGDNNFGDKPYSDSTAEAMDDEARSVVNDAYQRTVALIREHKHHVDMVANVLLEKETITHDDLVDLVGERPFKRDLAYDEYVRRRQPTPTSAENDELQPDASPVEDDDTAVGTGSLTPGLA
jgi:AFG3 family protein